MRRRVFKRYRRNKKGGQHYYVVISPEERKIFTHLSNPTMHSREYGGGIDFDMRGEVENVNVHPGSMGDIYLPTDYELIYHTHPSEYPDPPTPMDVLALVTDKNQKAEVVFRDGEAFVMRKPNKFKKPTFEKIKEAFDRSQYDEQKYKKELEKLGFKVDIDKEKNKPLKIDIKPVEED